MFGLKEKQDDLIDAAVSKFVEKADGRRRLLMILGLSLLGNFLIWMIVLFASDTIMFAAAVIGAFSSKLRNALFLIPIASGFMSAYSVFRMIFPDIENNRNLAPGLMSSFEYQNNSGKRYAVWVLSMIAGVLNAVVCVFLLRDTPYITP
jgi:hypothetical protein